MIPTSYAEWYECITVKCRIEMNREYIKMRLENLNDRTRIETEKFVKLYGENHLDRVLTWFQKALKEAKN